MNTAIFYLGWSAWIALFVEILRRYVFASSKIIRAGKLVFYALVRRQGRLTRRRSSESYAEAEGVCRLDPKNISEYNELCGYSPNYSGLPACYLEALTLKPMMDIVGSPSFGLSPLGLIHIRQTINIRKHFIPANITSNKPSITLNTKVTEYRMTDRGVEVDITSVVRNVEMVVWEGVTTLLSRSRATRRNNRRNIKLPPLTCQDDVDSLTQTVEIKVDGNIGRRYAAMSGDYSPHHLYGWTAWLLGYPRQIAHGMWTLSRCLAEVELYCNGGQIMSVEAEFKRPLLMPGVVNIVMSGIRRINKDDVDSRQGKTTREEDGCHNTTTKTDIAFCVEDATTQEPHVRGNVTIL